MGEDTFVPDLVHLSVEKRLTKVVGGKENEKIDCRPKLTEILKKNEFLHHC